MNPDNTRAKSAANVLISSLSKPLKQMHFKALSVVHYDILQFITAISRCYLYCTMI